MPSVRKSQQQKRPKWETVVESTCRVQLAGLQRQQHLARMRPAAARNLQNRVLHIIPHIDEANFLVSGSGLGRFLVSVCFLFVFCDVLFVLFVLFVFCF